MLPVYNIQVARLQYSTSGAASPDSLPTSKRRRPGAAARPHPPAFLLQAAPAQGSEEAQPGLPQQAQHAKRASMEEVFEHRWRKAYEVRALERENRQARSITLRASAATAAVCILRHRLC